MKTTERFVRRPVAIADTQLYGALIDSGKDVEDIAAVFQQELSW